MSRTECSDGGPHALFMTHFHLAAVWEGLALISLPPSCTVQFDSVIYSSPFLDTPWARGQADKQSRWLGRGLRRLGHLGGRHSALQRWAGGGGALGALSGLLPRAAPPCSPYVDTNASWEERPKLLQQSQKAKHMERRGLVVSSWKEPPLLFLNPYAQEWEVNRWQKAEKRISSFSGPLQLT